MIKKVLPYILVAALLASCMNAKLAFDGDDLLPPQLGIFEPVTSGNNFDVTFEAKLSEAIGKEKCGFYLSMDENFASSEKVSADHVDMNKGRFSYTKRIKDYGQRWYCKAYASNGKIEIHSRVSSYLVKPFSDYVSAEVPKIVSSVDDRAELSFSVSAVEGISLTECGVCYGLSADELSVKSSHVSSEGLAGEQTVSITGLTVGQDYYVCSYAREGENIVYSKAVSLTAVDLGLSVKWASCNLGATKPEEYGGYYQWAGLEDVTNTSIYLDCNNCPYHTGSSYETGWKKYVSSIYPSYWSGSGNPDNKTVLDPSDDVAHVKLGGKWRMPTDAEWTELINNCTWTWTTQNGVKGYKVTSKKSGYTSKSIFLPAAGYRRYDYPSSVGSYGRYWSSSLISIYPSSACGLYFDSGQVDASSAFRYLGKPVRPVSE